MRGCTNGIRVWWTKCQRKKRKEKGNVWMKERQRIRNDSGLSNDFQTWLSAKPYNSKHSCQRAVFKVKLLEL